MDNSKSCIKCKHMKVKLPLSKVGNQHFMLRRILYSSRVSYCTKELLVYENSETGRVNKTYLIAYRTDYPDFETAKRCLKYVDDSKEE